LIVETADGAATGSEELARFAHALDTHQPTAGAAASLNSKTGVISATFTVGASDPVAAAALCATAFREALSASGLVRAELARVVVERVPLGEAIAV